MEGEVSVEHVPSEKDEHSPVRNYTDETFCSESSDGNLSNRSKNNILLEKRRKTCTASGNPYRASASTFGARYVLLNANSKGNMNSIAQKVLSARMLRLKQLQNELNDAQLQINELSTENRILHTVQKRQDLALKRFEDKKADLPVLLNAHTEEVRTLRATMKQLRAQVRELEAKVKDRDGELTVFRERCTTLTDLCNNKQLEERDVLQKRVEELTKINEDQAERIKLLNRKVALESKNYEHRLKTETTNHRNTQRELVRVLENAAQLQAALDEKEKFIRSKIYPISNNKRRSETGSGLASNFSHGSIAQTRLPDLHKGDQLQGIGKGRRYFSEENTHNRSQSTRFSLVQDQVMPQSSDDKVDQLHITGTKNFNSLAPCYSLKQQKYGRRHQDHQTIQEDPDSDSQQTMVSSGAELFEDIEEHEEHITTDELSRESSPLEQYNSDQSKGFLDNGSEKPLNFFSSLHTPKSLGNSPVTSQTTENSLKNSSDNVTQASHTSGNANDTRHSHFNNSSISPNTKYDGHSSEEYSVEEKSFMRSSSLTEITCSDEKATKQLRQPCSSIDDVPKRVPKRVIIKEENVEGELKQHVTTEEENQSTLRKGELLAALEAIDKGENVHTGITAEHAEVDMDRAKKTNLMRELFGSS